MPVLHDKKKRRPGTNLRQQGRDTRFFYILKRLPPRRQPTPEERRQLAIDAGLSGKNKRTRDRYFLTIDALFRCPCCDALINPLRPGESPTNLFKRVGWSWVNAAFEEK